MSKINLQEPQRNRNATAFFVNLIMTSTVEEGKQLGMHKTGLVVQGLMYK